MAARAPAEMLKRGGAQRRDCLVVCLDHVQFLSRLVELELIDRERRLVERRIKAAKFPTVKSLDSFEFKAIPSLNKAQVLELARCEWIERRENVIALGPSGTGKSHVAQRLGLAACQRGMSVRFVTAAALVHELMEARDERRLLRLQKQLANHRLLIIDELGFVPLSKTGAELLFELVSQRYERAAVLITSNLPFDEWTETFGSERLTGALLSPSVPPRSWRTFCFTARSRFRTSSRVVPSGRSRSSRACARSMSNPLVGTDAGRRDRVFFFDEPSRSVRSRSARS